MSCREGYLSGYGQGNFKSFMNAKQHCDSDKQCSKIWNSKCNGKNFRVCNYHSTFEHDIFSKVSCIYKKLSKIIDHIKEFELAWIENKDSVVLIFEAESFFILQVAIGHKMPHGST